MDELEASRGKPLGSRAIKQRPGKESIEVDASSSLPMSHSLTNRASSQQGNYRLTPARARKGVGPEVLVTLFAHSHSASQFRRHLPQHWYSTIDPPH